MRPLVSLRTALEDPNLLGAIMAGESREPMRAILLASQGEALTPSEREHWKRLTQRDREPLQRVEELHILAGRRSGKSSGIAALAVYAACLCDFSDRLSAGEKGVVLVIAENQRQARILFDYISGVIEQSSALRKLVVSRTQMMLTLSNYVSIEVRAADIRGLRGLTLLLCLCEEICHWRSEDSVNPDVEIVDSVRPGLITTSGQLVSIGSTYAKSGYAYGTYKRDFGQEGDPLVIVANGPTRAFNSTIPQKSIDRAYARDPASAASEFGGLFRDDIAAYINRDAVESCVSQSVFERPHIPGQHYVAFVDPSGGSGQDSMTIAVAHCEKDIAVLDAIREARPPFSPDAIVDEFVEFVQRYRVTKIVGDRWGGEFVREAFRKRNVRYDVSEKIKSDVYKELLPPLNSRRVDLIDNNRLVNQFCNQERRTTRGSGKDNIDHPRGLHDDLANAAAGALVLALVKKSGFKVTPRMLELAGIPGPRHRFGDSPTPMRNGIPIVPF